MATSDCIFYRGVEIEQDRSKYQFTVRYRYARVRFWSLIACQDFIDQHRSDMV